MKPDAIKQDVLAGKTVAGAMVFEFFSPGMPRSRNAGAEFVLYDMEHTGLGFETLKGSSRCAAVLPIVPMVRVPRGEYHFIARALDVGALGVMVPDGRYRRRGRAHRRPARGIRRRAAAARRSASPTTIRGRRRRRTRSPRPRAHAGDRRRSRPSAASNMWRRSPRSPASTCCGSGTSTSPTSWASRAQFKHPDYLDARHAQRGRVRSRTARPPASSPPTRTGSRDVREMGFP